VTWFKICFRVGDSGLEVRISLWVREAPGSRPGCPRFAKFGEVNT